MIIQPKNASILLHPQSPQEDAQLTEIGRRTPWRKTRIGAGLEVPDFAWGEVCPKLAPIPARRPADTLALADLPPITAYIRQRGGGPWLAELVREVREAEADPFEGQPTPEQIEEENERKYGVWRPRPYDDRNSQNFNQALLMPPMWLPSQTGANRPENSPHALKQSGGTRSAPCTCPRCGGKLKVECFLSTRPGCPPQQVCIAVCLGSPVTQSKDGRVRQRPRAGCGRVPLHEFSAP